MNKTRLILLITASFLSFFMLSTSVKPVAAQNVPTGALGLNKYGNPIFPNIDSANNYLRPQLSEVQQAIPDGQNICSSVYVASTIQGGCFHPVAQMYGTAMCFPERPFTSSGDGLGKVGPLSDERCTVVDPIITLGSKQVTDSLNPDSNNSPASANSSNASNLPVSYDDIIQDINTTSTVASCKGDTKCESAVRSSCISSVYGNSTKNSTNINALITSCFQDQASEYFKQQFDASKQNPPSTSNLTNKSSVLFNLVSSNINFKCTKDNYAQIDTSCTAAIKAKCVDPYSTSFIDNQDPGNISGNGNPVLSTVNACINDYQDPSLNKNASFITNLQQRINNYKCSDSGQNIDSSCFNEISNKCIDETNFSSSTPPDVAAAYYSTALTCIDNYKYVSSASQTQKKAISRAVVSIDGTNAKWNVNLDTKMVHIDDLNNFNSCWKDKGGCPATLTIYAANGLDPNEYVAATYQFKLVYNPPYLNSGSTNSGQGGASGGNQTGNNPSNSNASGGNSAGGGSGATTVVSCTGRCGVCASGQMEGTVKYGNGATQGACVAISSCPSNQQQCTDNANAAQNAASCNYSEACGNGGTRVCHGKYVDNDCRYIEGSSSCEACKGEVGAANRICSPGSYASEDFIRCDGTQALVHVKECNSDGTAYGDYGNPYYQPNQAYRCQSGGGGSAPTGACTYPESCPSCPGGAHVCHGTYQGGECKYDPAVDPACQ